MKVPLGFFIIQKGRRTIDQWSTLVVGLRAQGLGL